MELETFKFNPGLVPKGLPDSFQQMSFTIDEVSHLKTILNKFDTVSVEKFTAELEHICREQIRILTQPKQTKATIEQDISDLLKTCRKAVRELQKVSELRTKLILTDNFNFTINTESGNTDLVAWPGEEWCYQAINQARPATYELSKFIECVEARPKTPKIKTGRPATEPKGFVTEIANLYELSFGTPATKYSTTFQGVVTFALEATGHDKHKDATRKIKRALSKT